MITAPTWPSIYVFKFWRQLKSCVSPDCSQRAITKLLQTIGCVIIIGIEDGGKTFLFVHWRFPRFAVALLHGVERVRFVE